MAKDLSNQIVGVCRFSYAGEGGFGSATMEQWALEAMLYDPARMKQRFVLFEQICLPSLAVQTEIDRFDRGYDALSVVAASEGFDGPLSLPAGLHP